MSSDHIREIGKVIWKCHVAVRIPERSKWRRIVPKSGLELIRRDGFC